MTKQEKKKLLITTCLCLCPMIIGIIMLPKLPDQIAIHFNIHNEPDGFASKEFFVFFFPCFMALMNLICVGAMQLDDNKEANKKMHYATQWIFPIISFIMYIFTILIAMEYPIDMRVVAMMCLGVMLIVLGNYLPKTKNTKHLFLRQRLIFPLPPLFILPLLQQTPYSPALHKALSVPVLRLLPEYSAKV